MARKGTYYFREATSGIRRNGLVAFAAISTVFIGWAEGEPSGSDDAAEAKAFTLDAIPNELCFDHSTIVSDYLTYKRTGKRRKI